MPSNLGEALTVMSGIRAGLGESTTRESWTHGIRTKFVLPLLQSWGLGLCLFLTCLCAWGFVHCLLIGTGRLFWMVFGSLGSACFGFGFALGAWNLGKELTDTFWRKSPGETATLPSVANLLDSMAREHDKQPDGGFVRLTRGDELKALLIGDDRPTRDDLPPRAANLMDFVLDCREDRDLAREHWIGRRLPSTGMVVSRDAYDALIDSVVALGWVNRGGWGKRASWRLPRGDVLRRMADEVYGAGYVAPESGRAPGGAG